MRVWGEAIRTAKLQVSLQRRAAQREELGLYVAMTSLKWHRTIQLYKSDMHCRLRGEKDSEW